MKKRVAGFTLIELLIVVAIIGIIAVIAVPKLMSAIDKGKQKGTMANIRQVGTAIEAYRIDNTIIPNDGAGQTLANGSGLALTLQEENYMKSVPTSDTWGFAFHYDVSRAEDTYTLGSAGKDGGGYNAGDANGETSTFDDNLLWSDGQFTRYPTGAQN